MKRYSGRGMKCIRCKRWFKSREAFTNKQLHPCMTEFEAKRRLMHNA